MYASRAMETYREPVTFVSECIYLHIARRKLADYIYSTPDEPFVTFIVGSEDDKKSFIVHKVIATSRSSFLHATFSNKLIEGQALTMRLEDVEVGIFGQFVDWLYFQKLKKLHVVGSKDADDTSMAMLVMDRAKMWTLADRFIMLKLQNDAMFDCMELFKSWTSFSEDSLIYNVVPLVHAKAFVEYAYAFQHPELRRLAIDMLINNDHFANRKFLKELAADVLVDITMTFADHIVNEYPRPIIWGWDWSRYSV